MGSEAPTLRLQTALEAGSLCSVTVGNSESPGGSEGGPSSCRDPITSVSVAEHFPGLSLPVHNSQHMMGWVFATKVGLWSPQSINILLQPCCGGRRYSLRLQFGGLQELCELGSQRWDSSTNEPSDRFQNDLCMYSFVNYAHQPHPAGGGHPQESTIQREHTF